MRGLVACLLAWACCMPAAAQERAAEPSEAQRCLTHRDGPAAQPTYPAAAYNANRGGRVQMELQFRGAQREPDTRVLLHQGDDDLLAAVEAHVRGLRLPCLAAGAQPAVLRQEYVFQRDTRRVHWSNAEDTQADERDRDWSCLVHASGFRAPEYPARARRQDVQGRVLARLRFDSAEAAPQIEVFSRPDATDLARAVQTWAEGYRVPCLRQGPISSVFTFIFRLGDDRYGFREVTLVQFMASVRGVREQTLQFDTTEMACPFELQVQYRRPGLPNAVGEPGERVPARRPLLEWLAAADLDLRHEMLDAVYGDSFKLAVPCMKINLKPKEK